MAEAGSEPPQAPDRLRRAERILRWRTGRIAVVLERVMDSHNMQAVLRSVESLGIQYIFVVEPPVERTERETKKTREPVIAKKITKSCFKWLTLRRFSTTADCVACLRSEGFEIWATDLSQAAVPMDTEGRRVLASPMPRKVAVVIGREADGVSEEMLVAAEHRIFLPMWGFTESFNLSVATALILQRIFDWCPEARGDLDEHQLSSLVSTFVYHQLILALPL